MGMDGPRPDVRTLGAVTTLVSLIRLNQVSCSLFEDPCHALNRLSPRPDQIVRLVHATYYVSFSGDGRAHQLGRLPFQHHVRPL